MLSTKHIQRSHVTFLEHTEYYEGLIIHSETVSSTYWVYDTNDVLIAYKYTNHQTKQFQIWEKNNDFFQDHEQYDRINLDKIVILEKSLYNQHRISKFLKDRENNFSLSSIYLIDCK